MDFLFEVGLEEVPARMLAGAEAELRERVMKMLMRERLVGAQAEAVGYSTPRRLAVLVRGVAERQEDVSEELMGPAVKIAYKDGVAGPAAVAFAKKAGMDVAELRVVTTAKGEYVAATAVKAGRGAAEVIAAEMPKEMAGIYWAKNMYWRAGKPERFVRPVRWMVALLGEAVVPVSFGGCEAGRITFGHRVLFGAEGIEISAAGEYAEAMRGASVMVEVEARRHTIRKALDRVCREVEGMRWREDHALVDKMTHMTEWPSVILGEFEREYLRLPEEVLVTVMRDHQNYFAVEDGEGRLAPHFLAVLNTVADAAGEAVIRHGNERVLRARFNDARFFWEFDQRVSLEERVPLLEKVTFQKDLGSYAAKTERVRVLAGRLARIVLVDNYAVDVDALDVAAQLAKTDLTSELVKEFTELQGKIGGLYARREGFDEKVAGAIYDHYLPKTMEDQIPTTNEGKILAIADKMDTISSMFGLGLEPTGSRDPFALRRAANGIVKTLGEGGLPLTLSEIVAAPYPQSETVHYRIDLFMLERLSFYLRDVLGYSYDVVNAVLKTSGRQVDDVRDAIARSEAIVPNRLSADFLSICDAFKRVKNILEQAREKRFLVADDTNKLHETTEIALREELHLRRAAIESFRGARNYSAALDEIVKFGPLLARFFDEVQVMTDQEDVRAARLKLLSDVCGEFALIADFSEIVVSG